MGIIAIEGATELNKWINESFEQKNYRIAIPTYKRHKTLRDKTLKVLSNSDVPSNIIDIFVADAEEKEIYERTLHKGTYANIIIGKVGLKENRTYIQNHYPEGQYLVNLDDDIEEIHKYINQKKTGSIDSLNGFFCYAFKVCEELNTGLWGVYPVDNPYFMKNSIACGLRFLNGTMFGSINTHDKRMYITLDDKDDYERSIKGYLKYQTVARFDFISYKSKEFTEAGGMQYDGKRTEARNIFSGKYLLAKYPYLCKQNKMRKTFELKLTEQRQSKKYLANMRIKIREN